MSQIPQTVIDSIRETSDILDVISQFVDLNKEVQIILVFVLSTKKKQLPLVLHLQSKYIIVLVVIMGGMSFLLLWNIKKYRFLKRLDL